MYTRTAGEFSFPYMQVKTCILYQLFFADNKGMKSLPSYTVSELMKESGKTRSAIETWLSRHKIKPISYEARYPEEVLAELIKVTRGRPKSQSSSEAPQKPRKSPDPKTKNK